MIRPQSVTNVTGAYNFPEPDLSGGASEPAKPRVALTIVPARVSDWLKVEAVLKQEFKDLR